MGFRITSADEKSKEWIHTDPNQQQKSGIMCKGKLSPYFQMDTRPQVLFVAI